MLVGPYSTTEGQLKVVVTILCLDPDERWGEGVEAMVGRRTCAFESIN